MKNVVKIINHGEALVGEIMSWSERPHRKNGKAKHHIVNMEGKLYCCSKTGKLPDIVIHVVVSGI